MSKLSEVERARYLSLVFCFCSTQAQTRGLEPPASPPRRLKHAACWWTEPGRPEARALGIAPEGEIELRDEGGQDRGVDAGADFRAGVVREVGLRSCASERGCPGQRADPERKRSDPAHAGCYKGPWRSTGASAEDGIGAKSPIDP